MSNYRDLMAQIGGVIDELVTKGFKLTDADYNFTFGKVNVCAVQFTNCRVEVWRRCKRLLIVSYTKQDWQSKLLAKVDEILEDNNNG